MKMAKPAKNTSRSSPVCKTHVRRGAVSRRLATMKSTIEQVNIRVRELGLNLSVWDSELCHMEFSKPASEFCQALNCRNCCFERWHGKLAGRAIAQSQPVKDKTKYGCRIIAVPIQQRRRLLGAAVACFPVSQMLDQDHLARLCDRLELDREMIERYARHCCRYSSEQAADLLRILGWLLFQEQEIQVARDELANLSDNLSSTYEELSLLYRISGSMQVTHRPDEFLRNVCTDLEEVFGSAIAAVVYANRSAVSEDIMVLAGCDKTDEPRIRALADKVIMPRLDKRQATVIENDFTMPQAPGDDGPVRNFIAVGLGSDGGRTGMLIAFNKDGDFDSVDLKLLDAIGNQTAVFLANNRLYADLQDLLMGVLHALTASIDAKDPYTCGHSQRVALFSRRIAEECGYPEEKVQRMYLAGLLHDIGKIGVPEAILRKPGRLTGQEYEVIKTHPSVGAKILGGIRQLDDLIPGILAHHERLDGKGYPRGLKAPRIPMEGLIIGLADCFDAMTSDRTYRKALQLDVVIEEIRSHSGTQFHPDLVEKFLSLDIQEFMDQQKTPAKTVFPIGIIQDCAK